jgi:hypothetical protein
MESLKMHVDKHISKPEDYLRYHQAVKIAVLTLALIRSIPASGPQSNAIKLENARTLLTVIKASKTSVVMELTLPPC